MERNEETGEREMEAGEGNIGATEADAEGNGGPADADAETRPVVERIREALKGVQDPELGINIVDLGLVYDIQADEEGTARIRMTLTSPGCPAGGQILSGAKESAESVEGVRAAEVNLVWKPFWTPEKMDPKVRASLGF